MTNPIKSVITTCYSNFISDFSDPLKVDKDALEKDIGCAVKDAFKSQNTADKARTVLGKDRFKDLISLYLNNFYMNDGIDLSGLSNVVESKVMVRHLGKDKLNVLNLIIKLSRLTEEKKAGLLFLERQP
jgi:hypothetical protein